MPSFFLPEPPVGGGSAAKSESLGVSELSTSGGSAAGLGGPGSVEENVLGVEPISGAVTGTPAEASLTGKGSVACVVGFENGFVFDLSSNMAEIKTFSNPSQTRFKKTPTEKRGAIYS